MTERADRLVIRPIGGRIGAEISGVDLQEPLSDAEAEGIRQALWRYKVIFFRGQHALTDDGQAAFGARLGRLTQTAHPTHASKTAGKPQLSTLDSLDANTKTDHWHTDTTFVQQPPAGAVLRAIQLPSAGGDTLWANAASAYLDLPEPLRDYVDRLWGVHSNRWGYGHIRTVDGDLPATAAESEFGATPFFGAPFETIHPLVRLHPQTGERSLLVGQHLRHILGLTVNASHDLTRLLQDCITRPENVIRWRWAIGDVAVWDNCATQHYAVRDYTERRVMHRVSLAGDVPVSVDGQPSRVRVGDLSAYVAPMKAAS